MDKTYTERNEHNNFVHTSHLDESDENECVSFEILTSNGRRAATAAIKTNGYKHNFYVTFLLIVQ